MYSMISVLDGMSERLVEKGKVDYSEVKATVLSNLSIRPPFQISTEDFSINSLTPLPYDHVKLVNNRASFASVAYSHGENSLTLNLKIALGEGPSAPVLVYKTVCPFLVLGFLHSVKRNSGEAITSSSAYEIPLEKRVFSVNTLRKYLEGKRYTDKVTNIQLIKMCLISFLQPWLNFDEGKLLSVLNNEQVKDINQLEYQLGYLFKDGAIKNGFSSVIPGASI